MRPLRLVLVGVVLVLIGGLGIWPAFAVSDVHVVNTGTPATPFGFSPATQAVNAGDTVQWINDTGATHTATSDDGTSFNVAISMSGGTSPTFSGATRDIPYHCSIHTYMTGTIHVVAAATTTTTKATTTTAKAVTTTAKVTTTSRATTSTTDTTLALETTTSEESSTTSSTAGQVAIKTKSGGGNGAAIAVLVVALAAVFGGGGYALYRMRRP